LQNSEAALISLESELESVKLYLSLEALRFDDHFEYKLSVDPELDISALKVPPLIIQPYAENAVWHGLMHKEEKGQLDIELWEEADFLYFKIADNGVGREQAVALASKTATRNKSMGLSITASRIARMQPEGDHRSPIVINDLVNPDGTAAGTEVIIRLPVIFD
jgi:LytS/YehU family sensor histidine kinase